MSERNEARGARSGSPRRAFASSRPVLGSLSREAAAGVTNSEERAVAEKRRALRSAARSEPRLNLPPGVERVAESIADEVDRQHDDEDAEPREDHPVRCDVDEVAVARASFGGAGASVTALTLS